MAKNNIKGITIKFDGDTKKLDKALRDVRQESKEVDSELSKVNRSLKMNPGNVTLSAQKMTLLKDKVSATKAQLEKYKDIQADLGRQGIDKNTEAWREVERKIVEAESKVKYYNQAINDLSTQKIEDLGNKFETVGSKMQGIGTTMSATVTAPIIAGFGLAASAASDYEENVNKVDVAFGNSAKSVKAWADTATEQFGLSKNSALEAAALFGDMGTSMGLTQDEAAKMSTSLSGLAGDLSSFKNIDVEQAMTALKGVFTGETESLKELGVVMTQDNLKQFAADAGLIYDNMSQAEKVQLRYNYVLAQTQNAQGDYARTSDGTANSIRTFKESLNNLAVVIGQEILPIITPMIQKLGEWVQKFSEMSPATKKIIVIVGAVAAAIGPLLVVIGTVISAVGSIMGLLAGVEVATLAAAAPILGIVAAIAAVIAAIALCVKHWKQIKAFAAKAINGMLDGMKMFGAGAKKIFLNVMNYMLAPYRKAWNLIKTIISKIKGLFPFHVKMPHLTLSPSGWKPSDILSGVIPSIGINWYKTGGIFSSPSVVGVGEAGSEAVVPLDKLWQQMDNMTASIVSGVQTGMASASMGGQINITVELGGTKVGEQIVKLYDRTKKAVG